MTFKACRQCCCSWRLPARCRLPPRRRHSPPVRNFRSVFAIPANPSEGRDPFFPSSIRVYGSNSDKPSQGPAFSELTVAFHSGHSPARPRHHQQPHLCRREDGDVIIAKTGQRLHIRCADINSKAGTVTVEADGFSQCCIYPANHEPFSTIPFFQTNCRAVRCGGTAKWFCIRDYLVHDLPLVERNRSQTMKKTKMIVVTLLAGFVLHQSAFARPMPPCQPTAAGGATAIRP